MVGLPMRCYLLMKIVMMLQGRSENVEATNDVVAMIKGTFPNVTVFPNVGNHESYPVNMFPEVADGNFSIKWLYRDIAQQFKEWLPDEEQQRTLRDAGYYSVMNNVLLHS